MTYVAASLIGPAAGLLAKRLAGIEGRRLTLDLVGDGPLDGAERVHVLDLDPDAELVAASRPERHVGLDPQLAPLHVGVRCADRPEQQLELLRVAAGLFGASGHRAR